ncbi:hypothetical protein C4K40_4349 [Pseudomonas sp. CMR5c]|nr:hypothetical protein C4K40_4349 [Pseudomonas sp. CMR5c]
MIKGVVPILGFFPHYSLGRLQDALGRSTWLAQERLET